MKPLLPIIKTRNYVIKLINKNDFDFYLSLYQDKKLMSLIGKFNIDLIKKSFYKSLQYNEIKPFKRLTFCIYKNNKQLGITSLIWSINKVNHCEIGTIIQLSSLNKGIAYDVMKHLIEYAFHNLEVTCIYANFSCHNNAANMLVNKLGFTVELGKNDSNYCYIINKNKQ